MSTDNSWTLRGAEGEPIIGDTHLPGGGLCGVALVAHGFKGYKDYGMFPRIAQTLADTGFIAHRFNFSHSGMTNDIEIFDRPDLFEKDTWNKQVHDLRSLMSAVTSGSLPGQGLPLVLFGHSRGGVSVLLTAGRFAGDAELPEPAGIVTASAPHECWSQPDEVAAALLAQGFLVSPSSRTGQDLRVGKVFLTEQQADPDGHHLVRQAARIRCPVLLIHGEADPTVPAESARRLAEAIGPHATALVIAGADHVYNTPNPMPPGAVASPQLQEMLTALTTFALECVTKKD